MTERLPFDPARIRPSPPPAAADEPRLLSVRQVNAMVRGAIVRHVPATLSVLGEIADCSRPGSGHLYFSLKDEASELRCVMWKSSAVRVRFELKPGMQVIATGGIEVYEPRGTYQLVVRRLEPRGVGALELAFRQLKDKLAAEGLFDAARKRPLPRVPFRVALITSERGAAIRDILRAFERRFPLLDILVFDVRVQGDAAAPEIAAAIGDMNRCAAALGGIDVAIVGRGGGSLEDLWPFNEEIVARAMAASRIPIVSAVGHETDVSIADLVADARAATPTAAAEIVAPKLTDLLDALDRWTSRAKRIIGHGHDLARTRLDALTASGWIARPLNRLAERGQRIDEACQRLRHAFAEQLRTCRERLARSESAAAHLGAGERFSRLGRRLDATLHRLAWASMQRGRSEERRLSRLLERFREQSPLRRRDRLDERIAQYRARLATAARSLLSRGGELLERRVEAAETRNPLRILRRGYSITREAKTRRVIRSVKDVRDGMRIITRVADGEFRGTADDPRQGGLFEE
jgi:exodeoxyribonuclease VII large subunit